VIAHGPFGVGIAFPLAPRLDLIEGTAVALLGVTWDFLAPMRPGDAIRAEIVMKGKREVKTPDHGLIELAIKLVNPNSVAAQEGTARLLMRQGRLASAKWG
jgi:acyl dehydratase